MHGKRANQRETSQTQSDVESRDDGIVVSHQQAGQLAGRHDAPQVCGAGVDDSLRGDIGEVQFQQVADELIVQYVLGDGDEHAATQRLSKKHERHACGCVSARKYRLSSHVALLHATAKTEAKQDLIADPFGVARGDGEGGDQTEANGGDNRGDYHERCVVPDSADQHSRSYDGNDKGEDQGNASDSGLNCIDAFDGLEPDWNVVNCNGECTTNAVMAC